MIPRFAIVIFLCLAAEACGPRSAVTATTADDASGNENVAKSADAMRAKAAQPLVIGESFTIESRIMGEARRVNVLVPTVYGQKIDPPMPVLYMLDGGVDEDFLHVAGLVQVLVSNGGMRPFLLVGIPNTQRRRDMTGPTTSEEDKKIAAVIGGSAAFRRFIQEELKPAVRARYRTTDEAAIVGESLAGLFVVETFLLEPELFDFYIAFDPSLWWNNEELLKTAEKHVADAPAGKRSVFLSNSNEPTLARVTAELARRLSAHCGAGLDMRYMPLPAESHATIYHPAALLAFRTVFAPPSSLVK
jgi:predicted alpha/beta superfamily hydrolase